MYKKSKILLGFIVFSLMMVSSLAAVQTNNINTTSTKKEIFKIIDDQGGFKEISKDILENPPLTTIGKSENLRLMGTQWTSQPGKWWDTDWEYRVNVTVSANGVKRSDWPVDVFLNFDPVAHKYSIRVIKVEANTMTEVPYQIWNITYANSTHLLSATVTFEVNIPSPSGQAEYQIYWSTRYKDLPKYSSKIRVTPIDTPSGTLYEIESLTMGWKIQLPRENSGRAKNMTLSDGTSIGHDWLHFGATRNPNTSYDGFYGTGNTNNYNYPLSNRYIVEEQDVLTKQFEGVIFVTYYVGGTYFFDSSIGQVGKVDYKYRIFSWGIILEEKITWTYSEASPTTYYLGGWVFDQDGSSNEPTFNAIGNDSGILYNPVKLKRVYGSLTIDNGGTSFLSPYGRPLLAAYVYYFTAGAHTITTTGKKLDKKLNVKNDGKSNPFVYVYDLSGNIVAQSVDTDNKKATIDHNINIPTTGYYIIVIGSYQHNSDPEPLLIVDVSVDGGILENNIYIGDYKAKGVPGYTINPNNIYATAFQINPSDIGLKHFFELEWSSYTENLDLFVYGGPGSDPQNGNLVAYSNLETGTSERTSYTFSSSGYFPVIIYKRSGSGANTPFTFTYYPASGFKFEDFHNFNSLDHVALFNNATSIGIGYTFLEEAKSPGVTYSGFNVVWFNKGTSNSGDYIYVALNYTGLTASVNDWLSVKYAVFVWDPSTGGSTLSSMYSVFNATKTALKVPVSVSVHPTERFKLKLTIKVIDNDGSPIPSASVKLVYQGNSTVLYSSTTNSSGFATFDVERLDYIINVTISSGNFVFENSTITKQYSTLSYTVFSDSVSIKFKNVVPLQLVVKSNTSPDYYLQDTPVAIVNQSDTAKYSLIKTNLTGGIKIYITTGNWIIAVNHSSTTGWDNIEVYSDSSMNNLVAGPSVNATVSITTGTTYWIKDLDVTTSTPASKLVLHNTLRSQEVYWGEYIHIYVNLTDQSSGNNIDGSVKWYAYNESNALIASGVGTQISTGYFNITIDTSNQLPAGHTYTIVINGTPTGTYLSPTPLSITRIVKQRTLLVSVTVSPGTVINWGSSLTFNINVRDGLNQTKLISGASVTAILYSGSNPITFDFVESSPGFYVNTSLIDFVDTGSYLVEVRVRIQNYTDYTTSFTMTINERKTGLVFDSYIELPWNNSYKLSVSYIDTDQGTEIVGADVSFVLKDASTKTIIMTGSLLYDGTGYSNTLDLTTLNEGTYIIEITAGKKNYENVTGIITFVLREHETIATKSATRITVYYNETVKVVVTYYDNDKGVYVPGATKKDAVIDGNQEGMPTLYKTLTDLGNGTYILEFNTNELGVLGGYTITITLAKQHYQKKTLTVALTVEPIPTSATSDKSSVSLEWGDNVTLNLNYERTIVFAGGIDNSDNHTFEIYQNTTMLANGTLEDLGGGKYRLNLNTTKLGIGSFLIYIFFDEAFHESQTLVITLDVTPISTFAYSDKDSITLIWGYETTLAVHYNRSRGYGVKGADLTISLINVSNGKVVGTLPWTTGSNGMYYITIDASGILPGSYIIDIELSKTNYTSQNLAVTLTVKPVPTIASVSAYNLTLYWNDSAQISFKLIRTDTLQGVQGAVVSYYFTFFENGSMIGREIVAITDGNGEVLITFEANDTFVPGSYVLTISATKDNYETVSLQVHINVEERPLTVSLSSDNIALVWGDIYNASLAITDGITGENIYLSSHEIELSDNINGSISLVQSNSTYMIVIDTTKLNAPIPTPTTITITISKTHYVSKEISFKLKVDPVVIEAVLSGPNSVTLNPITGGVSTYKVGLFDKSRGSKPITTASINLVVSSGADKYTIKMTSIPDELGYYQATVDWTNTPIFKPGETYTVSVEFESVTINGVEISGSLLDNIAKPEIKGATSATVDYLGGSTDLPGLGRVPALIAYPIIIVVLVVGSIVGYRIVSYMMLPPEVKELDKLIKQIEKGNYDFEAPTREETVMKILDELL